MKIILLIFGFIFLIPIAGISQREYDWGTFQAQESNGSVALTIQMNAGKSCDGIQIYRSFDGLRFTEIGEIPGVCGDPETEQRFSFLDEAPIYNAPSFYKLIYGRLVSSEIIRLTIINPGERAYLALFRPETGNWSILSKNPSNEIRKLVVFSLSGQVVDEQMSSGTEFTINRNLPFGLLSFWIQGQVTGEIIYGKMAHFK